jgi:magnesium-transporting ATPase (P-type)
MPTSDLAGSAGPTIAEILAKLGTDPKKGLNPAQLQERLTKYGPNALREEKKSALSAFLAYFWGPIPWMIEAAALMALIVRDWGDFTIITSLLLFNVLLGFWEEYEASNALDALKSSLALKARALRDGTWQQVDARMLVPGDIVRLYLGDVVPADCKLIQGDYISIDQSALTGESLPMLATVAVVGLSTFAMHGPAKNQTSVARSLKGIRTDKATLFYADQRTNRMHCVEKVLPGTSESKAATENLKLVAAAF